MSKHDISSSVGLFDRNCITFCRRIISYSLTTMIYFRCLSIATSVTLLLHAAPQLKHHILTFNLLFNVTQRRVCCAADAEVCLAPLESRRGSTGKLQDPTVLLWMTGGALTVSLRREFHPGRPVCVDGRVVGESDDANVKTWRLFVRCFAGLPSNKLNENWIVVKTDSDPPSHRQTVSVHDYCGISRLKFLFQVIWQ